MGSRAVNGHVPGGGEDAAAAAAATVNLGDFATADTLSNSEARVLVNHVINQRSTFRKVEETE